MLFIRTILFYVFFYFEMLLFQNKKTVIIINLILNVLWVVVVKLLHWGYWWYACVTALTVGVFFASYKDQIVGWVIRHYKMCFAIAVLGLVISYICYQIVEKMVVEQVLNFFFVAFFVVFLMKFRFSSRIFNFLGKISFEIYLTAGIVFGILNHTKLGFENYCCVPVGMILTVVAAWCIHQLLEAYQRKFYKLLRVYA